MFGLGKCGILDKRGNMVNVRKWEMWTANFPWENIPH